MPAVPLQLPLDIRLRDGMTFESFYPGENGEALATLRACADGSGEPFVYLAGPFGGGRSHLLQASVRAAAGAGRRGFYLPLSRHREWAPAMLEGMEAMALLCLDDLHCVAGDPLWEEALFALYNRVRDAGHALVAAGDGRPDELGLGLPDLVSRLAWGALYLLREPDDEGKLVILGRRARLRGMLLSEEVGRYLLKHFPRDLHSLLAILEHLDEASLSAQRRLTVPFVKQALASWSA